MHTGEEIRYLEEGLKVGLTGCWSRAGTARALSRGQTRPAARAVGQFWRELLLSQGVGQKSLVCPLIRRETSSFSLWALVRLAASSLPALNSQGSVLTWDHREMFRKVSLCSWYPTCKAPVRAQLFSAQRLWECVTEDGFLTGCVPGLGSVLLEPSLWLSWLSIKPRVSLH